MRLCDFSDITAIVGVGKVRFISIEKESEAFLWLICSELMRETANGLHNNIISFTKRTVIV